MTGPRGRWVTIAVWVAIGVGGYVARSHIGEVTAAGQSSFLPKGAESIQAIEVLDGAATIGGATAARTASSGKRAGAGGAGGAAGAPGAGGGGVPTTAADSERRRGPGGDRLRPRGRADAPTT